MQKKSFTLVELMIVIAILAILSAIVIFALNPAKLFDNFRDSKRVTDIVTLNKAISFLESWNTSGMTYGTSTFVYLSLPDTSTTCSSYALPTLATGYSYYCASSANYKNADGTGWVPLNFTVSAGNKYISVLPVDPINDVSYYYSYFPGGSYELTARMKNARSNSQNDGGYLIDYFELGSPNKTKVTPIQRNMAYNGDFSLGLTGWTKASGPGTHSLNNEDFNSSSPGLKVVSGLANIRISDFIPVDITKNYTMKAYLRSSGSAGDSLIYTGFYSYDKDYDSIETNHVTFFTNTQTTLAQNLNPGDTVVYLTSAANWKTAADDSYKRILGIYPYKDYPNFTYTRYVYYYASVNAGNNSITLNTPYSGEAKLAGTPVADHADGASCNYFVGYTAIPNSWTLATGTTTGLALPWASSGTKWRYGTKYIRPFVWANYSQTGDYAITIDDVQWYISSQ
jgi:prepilin-type N-terminal cleavage/methylation domain-containing protein